MATTGPNMLLYIEELKFTSSSTNTLFDVWILEDNLIGTAGIENLITMSKVRDDKSHFRDHNWLTAFNGFARVIEYTSDTQAQPKIKRKSILRLYEGGVKNGGASGFGRNINGETNNTFVGFHRGYDNLIFDS